MQNIKTCPSRTGIDELDLSVRTYNTLKRAGIDTIEELQGMSDDELARIRNFSRKCLDEVHGKLKEYASDQSVAPAQQEETAKSTAETLDELPESQLDEPELCENAAESIWDIDLIKEQIHKQEKMLSLCIECKDTPVKVRLKEEALLIGLGIMLMDMQRKEETEGIMQSELPLMKNNDQRKEWLRNYKSWGLWYEDEHIGARFYKYEFGNGAVLIAEEYTTEGNEYCPERESCYLHLVGGPEPKKNEKYGCNIWTFHGRYCKHPDSETELVEFLKYVQKK